MAKRSQTEKAYDCVELLRRQDVRLAESARGFRMDKAQRDTTVEVLVDCRLCRAKKGDACSKPSGGSRGPHAERLRDARAMILEAKS
jgi:hypothetical protein